MKCAVMMFSQTGDRWDAGFHLLRMEMQPRADELQATIPEEEAIRRLTEVPLRFKKSLMDLSWGEQSFSQRTVDAIERRYPHLSLAIIERDRTSAMKTLAGEIAEIRNAMDVMDGLCDPVASAAHLEEASSQDVEEGISGLRAGWIYPLSDPDRYWDEDDADRYDIAPEKRYSYARVPTGTDPDGCYLLDVWIVDDEGQIHPGYDACPVPVRTEDLDLDRGRPLAGETPKPKSIFDSDWLRR